MRGHLWKKGESGNPRGRPKGALNFKTQTIFEMMEKLDFHPFEKKLRLAKRLENKLRSNHFASEDDKTTYLGLYSDVLKDLLQYACPKLKQVDHFAHIEIIQQLQVLDGRSDAELQSLLEAAEELAHVGA